MCSLTFISLNVLSSPRQYRFAKIKCEETGLSRSCVVVFQDDDGSIATCKEAAARPFTNLLAVNNFFNEELSALLYMYPRADMTFRTARVDSESSARIEARGFVFQDRW